MGRRRRDPHRRGRPVRRRPPLVAGDRPGGRWSATTCGCPAPGWWPSAPSPSPTTRATASWSCPRSSWAAATAPSGSPTLGVSPDRHPVRRTPGETPPDAPVDVHFTDGALQRCRLGAGRRRGGAPDRGGRAGEGGPRPRPGGPRLGADRRPVAAAPAGPRLPDVLDLPRGRALRRHPRDAGPPRARARHLPGARRHDPAHRRRRPRPPARRLARPLVARTWRSTSTPSARWRTRSPRTARR